MKWWILILSYFLYFSHAGATTRVFSQVWGKEKCQSKEMYISFVSENSKPDIYLYQSFVPNGGSIEFLLNDGDYQIEAVSKEGCRISKKFKVKGEEQIALNLMLEQKS